jgi:hypothetical protein
MKQNNYVIDYGEIEVQATSKEEAVAKANEKVQPQKVYRGVKEP